MGYTESVGNFWNMNVYIKYIFSLLNTDYENALSILSNINIQSIYKVASIEYIHFKRLFLIDCFGRRAKSMFRCIYTWRIYYALIQGVLIFHGFKIPELILQSTHINLHKCRNVMSKQTIKMISFMTFSPLSKFSGQMFIFKWPANIW